ncbi:MAG TPA: DPP IV N-terminal domain-containing protein [Bryobacteraceae bacterium]
MMRLRFLLRVMPCGLLCAACLSAQSSGKKPITLDDVVAQTHARGISPIWSPDGRTFAYEEKGRVYRYDVAERKAKEWFQSSALEKLAVHPAAGNDAAWQNRRVGSESLQWFPDGKEMLAAEGGDLFIVRANGKPEQITKTEVNEEDPKLSPDGKQVLYRWKSNLYVIDLKTRQPRQLTTDGTPTLLNGQLDWVYPEELEIHTATWWSPDSKRIAYFQFDVSREFMYPQTDLLGERAASEPERYPQAGTANALVKLGVLSLEDGATHWMDLGETSNTLLARVDWLPDSSRIAVERLNRVQDQLDLLFCNPASGAVHEVLHEASKTWINMEDNLFLLKSRPEFLWTSEHDNGFRHIYRYSDKGELLSQLTSGDWEVKSITAIDEGRERVYFMSSEASPLESQLYRVGFNGGARTRLTSEAGVHTVNANDGGSEFIDRFSSANRPPETVLRNASGEQVAVLQPADTKPLEEYDLLPSEIQKITTEDGTVLYGRLIKPAAFRQGVKYPLIVAVYGGPGVQAVRDEWQGIDWNQALAHRGYVVWQMDNRGSNGRGHRFEEPIFREMGTQEVADQRLGVEHVVELGFVDPERIGITGWSYGGYMTIHSMLRAPDLFKVGVAGAPVTDWHNYDTIYTERYMDLPAHNAAHYNVSSNVQNAAKLRGRLLIVHNFEDDNVLFQNTMQMANALERANKIFFMQIYPEKTHGVTGPIRKTLLEEMTTFFDENLKK